MNQCIATVTYREETYHYLRHLEQVQVKPSLSEDFAGVWVRGWVLREMTDIMQTRPAEMTDAKWMEFAERAGRA